MASSQRKVADVICHLKRFQPPVLTGVVTFRLDDAPLTDLVFVRLLERFGFGAEFAVAARAVGHGLHLRTSHLRKLIRRGHTIANHSFSHGAAPATLDDAVREVATAAEWFEMNGIPTWSFVQPGSWVGDGPGHLTDRPTAERLSAALDHRYILLEGYGGTPQVRIDATAHQRMGLSHATIDYMSWSQVRNLLEQVARDRLFVQIVCHTAKAVKTRAGVALAYRLGRFLSLCAKYERAGLIRCLGLPGAIFAAEGGGECLIESLIPERGPTVRCVFKEDLVPGVSYRFECVTTDETKAPATSLVDERSRTTTPIALRRRDGRWAARFGVERMGNWQLNLDADARRIQAATLTVA